MQTALANIMDFFTGNARAFLLIALVIGFFYAWVKLSEKEGYYRWLLRINPKNAENHYSLGNLLEKDPHRLAEAQRNTGRRSRCGPITLGFIIPFVICS